MPGRTNPDPSWQKACAVATRSQVKKKDERTALKVPSSCESPIVDREKLKQMQREDESLRKRGYSAWTFSLPKRN